jgi:ribosomal protein S8
MESNQIDSLKKVYNENGNDEHHNSVHEHAKKYSENIKKILLDYQYIEAVCKFDNMNHNDQLVLYFSLIGMDDPDIVHSIMTIKEMVYSKY